MVLRRRQRPEPNVNVVERLAALTDDPASDATESALPDERGVPLAASAS